MIYLNIFLIFISVKYNVKIRQFRGYFVKMSVDYHFHGTIEQNNLKLKRQIQRAITDGIVTIDDADLIRNYIEYKAVSNSIGSSRKNKIAWSLIVCRRALGVSFRKAVIHDIHRTVSSIKDSSNYGKYAKKDLVSCFKSFLTYLIDEGVLQEIPLRKIQQIKPPIPEKKDLYAKIPSVDIAKKIIDCCDNPRSRLIACLCLYGCMRIGETVSLRAKNILVVEGNETVPPHLEITVCYKTKRPRKIPCFEPVYSAYQEWMNVYPEKETMTDDDFIIVKRNKKEPISYACARRDFDIACRRAEIPSSQKLTPHTFRKIGITSYVLGRFGGEAVPIQSVKAMAFGGPTQILEEHYLYLDYDQCQSEILQSLSQKGQIVKINRRI